ncbi:MAG: hypothetical protein PHV82_00065 [Victivallaceae bacterium]|nr:hypothetical protein [Victivallaceae bacterium]
MMKKTIISAAVLLLSVFAVIPSYALGYASGCKEARLSRNDWTFFQIGFWIDVPSSTANSNVYGLKTGWPISTGIGRVCGNEISWFVAGTDEINGLQACFLMCFSEFIEGIQASGGTSLSRDVKGIQASLGVCYNQKELQGLQASVVNISGNLWGYQTGGVNVCDNLMGLQTSAVNCADDVDGMQFAFVNVCKKLNGVQASLVNTAKKSNGVQFGVVNVSTESGVQFGLVNYIKGAFIPVLPLMNIKF